MYFGVFGRKCATWQYAVNLTMTVKAHKKWATSVTLVVTVDG